MLKMFVTTVGLSAQTGLPMVILRNENDSRMLALTVGQQEAVNITRALAHLQARRPRPLDMLMSFATATGYYLQKIAIANLDEESFRAIITLATESGEQQLLDARPCDALALALSQNAPIYVAKELTTEVRKERKPLPLDPEFKAFVETLRASDFAQRSGLTEDDEPAA